LNIQRSTVNVQLGRTIPDPGSREAAKSAKIEPLIEAADLRVLRVTPSVGRSM
jgi:hypothetical protein